MRIHTHIHKNSPTITPPSVLYFLFPSCFSMLSLSLEKLVTCGVIRSYNFRSVFVDQPLCHANKSRLSLLAASFASGHAGHHLAFNDLQQRQVQALQGGRSPNLTAMDRFGRSIINDGYPPVSSNMAIGGKFLNNIEVVMGNQRYMVDFLLPCIVSLILLGKCLKEGGGPSFFCNLFANNRANGDQSEQSITLFFFANFQTGDKPKKWRSGYFPGCRLASHGFVSHERSTNKHENQE